MLFDVFREYKAIREVKTGQDKMVIVCSISRTRNAPICEVFVFRVMK